MQVIPAIDILGGRCARLEMGEYGKAEYFSASPLEAARGFAKAGAGTIHVVDLDGAKEGRMVNFPIVREIAGIAEIQVGGGIRTEEDLGKILFIGAKAIVSTGAVESESFQKRLAECKNSVLLAIDARDGKMALRGWESRTPLDAYEFAKDNQGICSGIIFTSISRDGMMGGPDIDAIKRMKNSVAVPLIAAGGVSSYEDIADLKKTGIYGCIVGKALYRGAIEIGEALRIAK